MIASKAFAVRWCCGLGLVIGCQSHQPVTPPAPPPPVKQTPFVATGDYSSVYSGLVEQNGLVANILALKDVSADQTTCAIDVVSASGAFAPVSVATTADPYSIVVAPAPPESVIFRINLSLQTNTGDGVFVELSGDPATPPVVHSLLGGTNLAPGGLYFGAAGDQILFCANFDQGTDTCDLNWSTGTSDPIAVANGVDLATIAFNQDRTVAFAAANADTTQGTGDLITIDMSNGSPTPIAQGVVVRALGYVNVNSLLTQSPDLAFTISNDGRSVAYAVLDGGVSVWTDGQSVQLAASGRFPSVSPDGSAVAYFSDGKLVVWRGDVNIASVPWEAGVLAPLFSSDDRYVAFLTSYMQLGANAFYGTALGDVNLLDLQAGGGAVAWGRSVAWHSVAFTPATGTTTTVTMLTECYDLTGTPTLDGSVANLVAGDPSLPPPTPIAFSIDPYLELLPLSGGIAYVAEDPPYSAAPTYVASVWVPGETLPRTLTETAVNGGLVSGATLPTLGAPSPFSDEILFLGQNAIPSFQTAGYTLDGAETNGVVFTIDSNVVDATIANDGRVLVVQGVAGMQPLATIQVFPFASMP